MNWRPYLEERLARAYRVTDRLIDLVTDADLDFKPETGTNWMTVGQLLEHIAGCGGVTFEYFVGGRAASRAPEDGANGGLPMADALPTVTSVAEARRKIEADRQLAADILAGVSDEDLEMRPSPVYWDPREVSLGQRISEMVDHLVQHKGQLFYYLKLMGRDVNTSLLWGM
jgi:uncharacterized damage-inducible protein DinB